MSSNFDNGTQITLEGPPLPGTTVNRWRLNFAAPHDGPLTPGIYPDFQRWPFQASDRPGLEFSSTGRLDNRASGFFEILNTQTGFAANFTHYGETNTNNWAVVEVRYNATFVPEPTIAILLVAYGALPIRRRKSASERRVRQVQLH
jgi:hypothetical protein